jgi:hypothetical protein
MVMETSIFNLTQPEATGLAHYGADNIQVIELVRLEAPAGAGATAAAPGNTEAELPPPPVVR